VESSAEVINQLFYKDNENKNPHARPHAGND